VDPLFFPACPPLPLLLFSQEREEEDTPFFFYERRGEKRRRTLNLFDNRSPLLFFPLLLKEEDPARTPSPLSLLRGGN